MKITLDKGAYKPTRAHENDAGLDLYARETQIVPARESAVFDTGVHIELPYFEIQDQVEADMEKFFSGLITYTGAKSCLARFKTVGFLKSKSGLNVKHGITSEDVIDTGYTGSIKVKLYNHSGVDYKVNAGDKITQLVIMPILTPEIELVDSLEETERGNSGFGSSGR